nr:IclR family transcriptional regulator [uncultured Dongia sp.]
MQKTPNLPQSRARRGIAAKGVVDPTADRSPRARPAARAPKSKAIVADSASAEAGPRARGIDRAFHILEFLQEAKRPMRPNEIAIAIGAPKSTVYDIIGLLLRRRVLEPTDAEGRVFLGRRLYLFGLSYLHHFDIMRLAVEYLDRLSASTTQTAQFCMVEDRKYVVMQMKEGERHFRISSDVGEPVPLPWTASGRLLVSHLDDADILDLIPSEDFILPRGKRLKPEAFLAEVHQARAEGFFSSDGVDGHFTHCFAAAVHDQHQHCVATLCLLTPREEGLQNHRRYRKQLTDAAYEMSARLGGVRPGAR